MREGRECRDRGHHDEDRAPFAGAGRPRDARTDALGEPRFGQRGRNDEHRGHDDGGFAGEAGKRLDRRQQAGRREREERQHGRDVDADALADEERQRAGDDGQEDDLFVGHGRRWRDFTRQAATLYYSSLMSRFLAAFMGAVVTGCAANPQSPAEPPSSPAAPPAARAPFSSTYTVEPAPAVLIRGATVLTGTGTRIDGGDVLIENGRISAVGQSLTAPPGTQVIDATGRWVTPGLIDVHSHMGVYANPGVDSQNDGNEATDPVTSNVWAEHSVWPQDPGFEAALQGGVTSLQILPGSANLIGGRGVTIKNVPATTYQAMKFPGAPQSTQDGLRRKPEACVRTRRPVSVDAHGQCRGLSPGLRRCEGLHGGLEGV